MGKGGGEGGQSGKGRDVGVAFALCNLGGTSHHITEIIPPYLPPPASTKCKTSARLGKSVQETTTVTHTGEIISPVCSRMPDKPDGSEIPHIFLPLTFLFLNLVCVSSVDYLVPAHVWPLASHEANRQETCFPRLIGITASNWRREHRSKPSRGSGKRS